MISELLKVDDPEKSGEEKLSQSRVYLLLTFITMLVVIVSSIFVGGLEVGMIDTVTDVLLTMLFLFSGYSLTGKGMKTLENIRK